MAVSKTWFLQKPNNLGEKTEKKTWKGNGIRQHTSVVNGNIKARFDWEGLWEKMSNVSSTKIVVLELSV